MPKPGLYGKRLRYYRSVLRAVDQRKLINLIRLYSSYTWSRITGGSKHWGSPMAISVEPTNRCQLKCPGCPCGTGDLDRPGGFLDPDLLDSILRDLRSDLIHLSLFFQGEPLLHPQIGQLIRMASERRIYTVISTNGYSLNKDRISDLVNSGLDHLIVSVDGMTNEVYQAYRVGGELTAVLDGIERVIRLRSEKNSARKPLVEAQMVVTRKNEHQVEAFVKWARASGVDLYRIKSAQITDPEENREWIPRNDQFSRYAEDDAGSVRIKSCLRNHCWRVWSATVITWDGKVLPCCFDKGADHVWGNASQEPVSQIVKNKKAAEFRSRIRQDRKQFPMCCNCTEGLQI